MENDFKEQFRKRAAAILTAPEAKLCPRLADHLAYESDMDTDAALGAMKAWKVDYDNQRARSGTQDFVSRKTADGALGLATLGDEPNAEIDNAVGNGRAMQ